MQFNNCRICGSDKLGLCLDLPKSTRNISKLLKDTELSKDFPINLKVYKCDICSFVQLNQSLEDDFYDDYVMTVSHSYLMNKFQFEQAKNFVEQYGLQGVRIIEIGCGDGNFLTHLKKFAPLSIGLEPSLSFRQLAIEKGHEILSDYVSSDSDLPGAPYHAFITREVLEHVPNPNEFLKSISRSLSEGAIGLVEVPCLEKALRKNRFYDFFADHLNYFSLSSLKFVLEKNGFTVLELMHGMNDEFNVAIVKKNSVNEFAAMQKSIDSVCSSIRHEISKVQGKVAVYGSGAKGLTILSNANVTVDDIEYVIDSDPHKQGLFTPVSHLPVVSPDVLLNESPDLIIITAMAYKDEIVDKLRTYYHYKGKLMALDSWGLVEA
jgi:SAM-dependent methyltransferase